MRLANERQQVVLAQRIQFDITDDDHLVVVRVEQCAVDYLLKALLIAMAQVLHGFRRARWRVQQALAIRVFADALQNFAVVSGQFLVHDCPCLELNDGNLVDGLAGVMKLCSRAITPLLQ
ncbi:hypothetical protein D3C79_730210 [compost metagenome]